MKKLYLPAITLLLSFSVLFAQEKRENLNEQSAKANVQTINKAVDAASRTGSINSPQGTAAVATYDFTVAGAAYTTGPDPMVEVSTGVWAMFAGNGTSVDKVVDGNDYGVVFGEFFQTGYKLGDYNLDGVVDGTDYGYVFTNFFKASQVPN